MATRSVQDIVQDAVDYIHSVSPNITTLVGSVTRDVVIGSPAQEFGKVYTELNRISQIQSLDNPTVMTTAELDSLGANFSTPRNQGTPSQATLTFRVSNLQSTEPNIPIPSGSVATTQQTAITPLVSFVTTQSGTFISSLASTYFNPLTGFYELTLPVQAQTVGANGNVAAGAINVLSTTISRVFSVTNTVAATGGTDQESQTAYAARIKLRLAGNNLGTVNGILGIANQNASVLSVAVVGPNDPEMLRNEFGGSVDLYILGTINTQTTDTNTFSSSGTRSFTMAHQPAIVTTGTVTVSGIANGFAHIFVEGIDYQLVSDPTTLLDGSTRLHNGILFLNSGTLPDNNSQFTITYTYNQLIETLQNTFDDPSNHIVTSDILVKEAHEALIDVSASIAITPGFNGASTISAAQTALTAFLNVNKLGNSFSQSEVVAVIENTPGVAEVDLTSLVIKKNNVVVTTQVIPLAKTEFITVNTINLSIIV